MMLWCLMSINVLNSDFKVTFSKFHLTPSFSSIYLLRTIIVFFGFSSFILSGMPRLIGLHFLLSSLLMCDKVTPQALDPRSRRVDTSVLFMRFNQIQAHHRPGKQGAGRRRRAPYQTCSSGWRVGKCQRGKCSRITCTHIRRSN